MGEYIKQKALDPGGCTQTLGRRLTLACDREATVPGAPPNRAAGPGAQNS